MSVGIAHHCEIANHAAYIYRRLNQNVLLSSQFSYAINFFPRVALKPKVIETRLYFILNYYQNEDWIFTGFGLRAEPDIVSTLEPSIAHD